jgi:hypothetical protein
MMMPLPPEPDLVSKDDDNAVARRTSQQCRDGMAEQKVISTVATVAGYDNQPERKFKARMWHKQGLHGVNCRVGEIELTSMRKLWTINNTLAKPFGGGGGSYLTIIYARSGP